MTQTKSKECDIANHSIEQRSTNRSATLAAGAKCPTKVVFPTSHGFSMAGTREDSGAYKAPLALWDFIALEALRTTSLGTDVSMVAKQKKKSGDQGERHQGSISVHEKCPFHKWRSGGLVPVARWE